MECGGQQRCFDLSNFHGKEHIGGTRHATVWRAVPNVLHTDGASHAGPVALKTYTKNQLDTPELRAQVDNEIFYHNLVWSNPMRETQGSAGHHGICRVLGAFDTRHHKGLVLEYCDNGDLKRYLLNFQHQRGSVGLPELWVQSWMRRLLQTIHFLHQNNVKHGNISLSNLLLTRELDLRLTDFGQAGLIPAIPQSASHLPPLQYEAAGDLWQAGGVLYHLIVGRAPWRVEGRGVGAVRAFERTASDLEPLPDAVSPQAADLLRRLLDPTYCLQPNLPSLIDHPFLNDAPPVPPRHLPSPDKPPLPPHPHPHTPAPSSDADSLRPPRTIDTCQRSPYPAPPPSDQSSPPFPGRAGMSDLSTSATLVSHGPMMASPRERERERERERDHHRVRPVSQVSSTMATRWPPGQGIPVIHEEEREEPQSPAARLEELPIDLDRGGHDEARLSERERERATDSSAASSIVHVHGDHSSARGAYLRLAAKGAVKDHSRPQGPVDLPLRIRYDPKWLDEVDDSNSSVSPMTTCRRGDGAPRRISAGEESGCTSSRRSSTGTAIHLSPNKDPQADRHNNKRGGEGSKAAKSRNPLRDSRASSLTYSSNSDADNSFSSPSIGSLPLKVPGVTATIRSASASASAAGEGAGAATAGLPTSVLPQKNKVVDIPRIKKARDRPSTSSSSSGGEGTHTHDIREKEDDSRHFSQLSSAMMSRTSSDHGGAMAMAPSAVRMSPARQPLPSHHSHSHSHSHTTHQAASPEPDARRGGVPFSSPLASPSRPMASPHVHVLDDRRSNRSGSRERPRPPADTAGEADVHQPPPLLPRLDDERFASPWTARADPHNVKVKPPLPRGSPERDAAGLHIPFTGPFGPSSPTGSHPPPSYLPPRSSPSQGDFPRPPIPPSLVLRSYSNTPARAHPQLSSPYDPLFGGAQYGFSTPGQSPSLAPSQRVTPAGPLSMTDLHSHRRQQIMGGGGSFFPLPTPVPFPQSSGGSPAQQVGGGGGGGSVCGSSCAMSHRSLEQSMNSIIPAYGISQHSAQSDRGGNNEGMSVGGGVCGGGGGVGVGGGQEGGAATTTTTTAPAMRGEEDGMLQELLDTRDVPPQKVTTKWGLMEVTERGDFVFPYRGKVGESGDRSDGDVSRERGPRAQVLEGSRELRYVIEAGGLFVRIEDPSDPTQAPQRIHFRSLSSRHRMRYRYAFRVVETLRAHTARITLKRPEGTYRLMSNTPRADFVALFSHRHSPCVKRVDVRGGLVTFKTHLPHHTTFTLPADDLPTSTDPSLKDTCNVRVKCAFQQAGLTWAEVARVYGQVLGGYERCLRLSHEREEEVGSAVRRALTHVVGRGGGGKGPRHSVASVVGRPTKDNEYVNAYRAAYRRVFPATVTEME
ncbi:unnamed protein product [Vitrella brassicaformis CCMP3155]|uniref:Protein kinase domain-containing protein n=3 Tax=Vitrella brassicaformis TaxID=1169539 RepID=A0A0G4EPZ8_VITBC|nr:unnamed protein product [Vitrella brassicaformis CCMP3155]|eukprot:CEL99471.1 unnamed protein product [Vitrella brassicaformis CCMP3155]